MIDTLDAASLGRFPWKIRFDVLRPNQRWALFAQKFVRLSGELAEAEDYKAKVWRLERLTPGDVAVVVRQYALWDEPPSAGKFYDRLCMEVAAKREDFTAEPVPMRTMPKRSKMAVYE